MKYPHAKVKPCPFCGSMRIQLKEKEIKVDDESDIDKNVAWLRCLDCAATGPIAVNEKDALQKWGLQEGFSFEQRGIDDENNGTAIRNRF